MDTSKYTSKDAARFWAKTDKSGGDNSCWNWTASRTAIGYGQFQWHRKSLPAHRIAYELVIGLIPQGLWVLHACDNRACVNPAHLFIGTRQDNIDDMNRKGRGVLPPVDWRRDHPERIPRGSNHRRAKLTEADVILIRQRFAAGGVTKAQLAREAGVGMSTLCHILARDTWRHIP